MDDLRDLDRENDDEEALQQAAEAFWQGQEEGADVERGKQIGKWSDDASKQIMEQVVKVVSRPLRESLQAPQDDHLANRQADEDAEEDRGRDQVVLDCVPNKLGVHYFQECLHVRPSVGSLQDVLRSSRGF